MKARTQRHALTPMLAALCATASSAQPALDRTVLPVREPARKPITELDARKAKMPPRFEVKAPKGAPNVVIVLIDDLGFGATSTFGGPVRRRRSTGWRRTACATTISTPPRCARRRARR
ncbi:MAG: hypothetical protein U5L03_08875 [Burkholderiaceae bacterium]|nr:hypothetical protein [Burkholderiaceae bacterium]